MTDATIPPDFSNVISDEHIPRSTSASTSVSGPMAPAPGGVPTPTTAGDTPRPTLPAGHLVGRYRIDALLGQGAWSTVYRVTDTSLNLPVVLKVLSPMASPTVVERFKNEILFSRRVNHPGFCRIFELHDQQTTEGPLRSLTMELIEGRTLGDVMNEGPMPPGRALAIARSLCDVTAAAHEQGVVHGDLKPGNVMVRTPSSRRRRDRRGEARDELVVLDFGAATATDLNVGGGRVGSLRYMAPELFAQEAPSSQSDVWAIGVILYGCLTGGYPFEGRTELELAAATRRPPSPPSSVRPALPAHLDTLVLSALAPERAARYADCRAFAAGIDACLEGLRPARGLWQQLRTFFQRPVAARDDDATMGS
jgi:serine/threonine-protein kinase